MSTRDLRPVTFRFRSPSPPQPFVDLRGDLTHWCEDLPLRPTGDGWLETSLLLAPGCYGYKLRLADGRWLLDPDNPRTRSCEGLRNSLLVLGGADEPLLHAPAPPDLLLEDDGRLTVRAGLRRGAGEALVLRYGEGHGFAERAMTEVAAEDEHRLFEVRLPVSAGTVEYLFRLPDGRLLGAPGGAGQALSVRLASLRRAAPDWWADAVLYTVFVDRFRRGGQDGRWAVRPEDARRAGGDLAGVCEALPYLTDLGVTALHLTPLAVARSAHRYDGVEPRRVDPTLGGEPALARLFDAAHAAGLRVLLDVPVTHVHRDFAPFADVRRRGPASPWWDWFEIQRFPFVEGPDPGYAHYQKEQWFEPLLRLNEPEVADHVVATFEHWTRLGADGFRLDGAARVPLPLSRRLVEAVQRLRPDAVVFGEVIADNLHRFTGAGGALVAATDFVLQQGLYDWLGRHGEGGAAAGLLARQARRRYVRGTPGHGAIGFTATHDQHRLATLTGSRAASRLGLLQVLTRPEVPALLYGDEIGLQGPAADRAFEDVWPDRMCFPWEPAAWDGETLALARTAIQLRRSSPALRRGDWAPLPVEAADGAALAPGLLAFRRTLGEEVLDVLLQGAPASSGPLRLSPAGAPSGVEPALTLGEVALDAAAGTLRLGPWSGVVLRRTLLAEHRLLWQSALDHAGALADQAFRAGEGEGPFLPTQLYLTVTEACNLRCRHCLNHSPLRTTTGHARELRPWLLDRLADAFAAARYLAFSHGGESLVSPRLFEALAAYGRARAGRPGRSDVHLLTNGMLLTPEVTRRLLDLGLTSLAVSVDGATAATHDALRLGSELATVLRHVAAAVQLRTAAGADLRLGLSWVVSAANVDELPALGRLAREAGVDWVKVEELVPATPWARHAMLLPGDPRLGDGLAALRATLDQAGIVLVDHLAPPPPGCAQEASRQPAAAAFFAADAFANRASFDACRLPWQQACVDPDGTVRPVAYERPPLGNLLDEPLLRLWQGETVRRLRQQTLAGLPRARCQSCVR